METPEELAWKIKDVAFDPWRWNSYQEQHTGYFDLEEAVRLITVRDAAIRAECAERAVVYLKNNYQDWTNIVTVIYQLHAAIMGEPEEAGV